MKQNKFKKIFIHVNVFSQILLNISIKNGTTIKNKSLKINCIKNWLIIVTISKFNKILNKFFTTQSFTKFFLC